MAKDLLMMKGSLMMKEVAAKLKDSFTQMEFWKTSSRRVMFLCFYDFIKRGWGLFIKIEKHIKT